MSYIKESPVVVGGQCYYEPKHLSFTLCESYRLPSSVIWLVWVRFVGFLVWCASFCCFSQVADWKLGVGRGKSGSMVLRKCLLLHCVCALKFVPSVSSYITLVLPLQLVLRAVLAPVSTEQLSRGTKMDCLQTIFSLCNPLILRFMG